MKLLEKIKQPDEDKISDDLIVQMARLALTGRHQDIMLYIRRIARRYRDINPRLAEKLSALTQESPTLQSPLRNESVDAIPVDLDSRLQLARVENVVELPFEPIFTPGLRERLDQVVAERLRERELAQMDLMPTRSLLFVGPPGVGKSLAARWLACKLSRPLITLDLAAVMSSFLGRTGNNLRHVLDYAKGVPCLLLLDEFDAIAKRRDDATEVGELKRLVTVLLQEIDDWPSSGLLIAATNHPELLDPASWRRFDMVLDFEMPNREQAQQAVALFLGSPDSGLDTWIKIIAVALNGLSFSDLERELLTARREAVVLGTPLEESFLKLVRKRMSSLSRSERTQVALELSQLNFSQRAVSDWTGVSRDTLRKAARSSEPRKRVKNGRENKFSSRTR